jgi:hypothetical protein
MYGVRLSENDFVLTDLLDLKKDKLLDELEKLIIF